ncbi:glutathione S-transferase N-terminal domain-containing protein [Candidatus Woesearchaeota archaeon]|nr:glutathione S-transferase N-terminal domain-containing protein [Candidatus Woesearchaeota archaeon]
MTKIILYQYETCPFCAKVRDYMSAKDIEFEKINVSYDSSDPMRKEIKEKSGVGTLPVIKDGDRYVGDSGAIIEYLEDNYN